MPSKASLICVDPKRVHEFWPHVKYMLHSAVKRTGLAHTQDLDFDVLSGDGLLWLAWNGEKIEAAATTSLVENDAGLVCLITSCGGEDMKRWLGLLSQIEDYAQKEGCLSVRLLGRKGWARVLDGYETTNVVLERKLI